ncbi:MAG: tetratricopeptide repeat protein [Bacteroidia bacterium]
MRSKLNSIFILITLFTFGNVSGENAVILADSAKKAYDKQQYRTAISQYERILADGSTSSALHYNLGNAYYRNGQLGKAIYHYEIAKKMNPNDEDVLTNLRLASSKTIDKIDVKENFFVNSVKSNIYTFFSTNGWAWATIVLTVISLLFFTLYITAAKISLKRIGFWFGSLGIIAVIISFFIGFGAVHNLRKKSQAIVTSSSVPVMNAPNESGKSQFNLHEGTKVNILESNEEWTCVKLDNGNEGWVKTGDLGLF